MLAAFENWFNRSGGLYQQSLAILRILGLFDRPADASCIGALRKPPIIAGLTNSLFIKKPDASTGQTTVLPLADEDWNTATSFLADFGLVVIQNTGDDRDQLLYCHPLIREHFAMQIGNAYPEAWQFAHDRLFEHLRTNTKDKSEPTVIELIPLYQAVAHGCKAGRFEEALIDVLDRRIRRRNERYTLRRLCVFSIELEALACFFSQMWTSLMSRGVTNEMQGWLFHETAFCLRATGRLIEAKHLVQTAIGIAVGRSDWINAANGSLAACELNMTLGSLTDAIEHGERSISFADRTGDFEARIESRCACAAAHHQAGRLGLGLARFRVAETFQQDEAFRGAVVREVVGTNPRFRYFNLLHSIAGFRYCDLLLENVEQAAWFIVNRREQSSDEISTVINFDVLEALECCSETERRIRKTLTWVGQKDVDVLSVGFDQLTLGRIALYRILLSAVARKSHEGAWSQACHLLNASVDTLRRANQQDELPCGLLTRAWMRFWDCDADGARSDLNEAWDIAERGPMRLHMADINLYRARLFFREKRYPWKSPSDDLANAEQLINDCGYHRRDDELADAKQAILGK